MNRPNRIAITYTPKEGRAIWDEKREMYVQSRYWQPVSFQQSKEFSVVKYKAKEGTFLSKPPKHIIPQMLPKVWYKRIKIKSIVDGDTVKADVDNGFGRWEENDNLRFWLINTAELRSRDPYQKRKAIEAREALRGVIERMAYTYDANGHVHALMLTEKVDSFERYIARIMLPVLDVFEDTEGATFWHQIDNRSIGETEITQENQGKIQLLDISRWMHQNGHAPLYKR